ncbi:hypothetical protein AB3S75_020475 [Citrus x aurantiifolia]
MQNKLSGIHSSKKPDLLSSLSANSRDADCVQKESCKEEFVEWTHGLLAIGTIGNVNLKDLDHDSVQDPTPDEEVATLQNEVNLILHEPEDSEVDDETTINDSNPRTTTAAAFSSAGKDISFDSTKSTGVISSKSLSFLLKKMIACRSGFAPAPSLKDPVSESQMEKIMRAILHKKMKIYPQSSGTALSSKKYLKSRTVNTPESANEDDFNEDAENGSKWVKTDSEYIVLEI